MYIQRIGKAGLCWGLLHLEHDHHKCFYEARDNKGTKYTFAQQWHEESLITGSKSGKHLPHFHDTGTQSAIPGGM